MLAVAEKVRVFWQPGCTSCLRTKEFLTRQGVDYESVNVHGNEAAMEELRTAEDIASYGEGVLARAKAWWAACPDRSCQRTMPTYFGEHPVHIVLERTVWHPAQHTRQLMLILETHGIAPDRPLSAADLAGLPLPEKAWDED